MKNFFKVTILSALLTFLRMVAGFIIGKVVAVYTGPSGVAMLGQVQSLVSISTGIIASPVGNGLIKYTAESHEEGIEQSARWWRAGVFISMIFFVITVPIVVFYAKSISFYLFKTVEYKNIVMFSCLTLPLSTANVLFASVLNGQEQYKRYITSGMASVVISTVLILAFVPVLHLKAALFIVASGTAISGCILFLYCMKMSWFRARNFFGRIEKDNLLKIAQYTLMVLVSAICLPTAILLVRNLLVRYCGWQDAGEWQAVWKISEVYLAVITISLSTYVLPKLSRLKESVLIIKEVNNLIVYVIPVTLALAVGIYFSRDLIIKILFTSEFGSARDLFFYQLLGDIIKIAAFVYAYPMLAQAKTKIFIISEVLFGLAFFVLALYFIKLMGVQGANVAYLINYIFYFIFCFSYTNFFMKDNKELS